MQIDQQVGSNFKHNAKYHSQVECLLPTRSLPLYQMTIKPFEYYVQYDYCGDHLKYQFYRHLSTLGCIIVSPEYCLIQNKQFSKFSCFQDIEELSSFQIHIFFKYYNFTLLQWTQFLQKEGGVASEQELIYIMKSLLSLAAKYKRSYKQCAGIFHSNSIFINPEKKLRIYPFHFSFHNQVSPVQIQSRQSSIQFNQIRKNNSISTTLSSSQIGDDSQSSIYNLNAEMSTDLRDIYLLVLQLVTFRKYQYFYSSKHRSFILDAIFQQLTSPKIMSHLSREFVGMLIQIGEGKYLESEEVEEAIERLTRKNDNFNIRIKMDVNKKCVQINHVGLKESRKLKQQKLSDKLSSSKFVRDLRQKMHSKLV